MQAKIYHPSEHEIDGNAVDPYALTVIERLRDAGYEAYLVGGGVRDLLTRRRPKDFDISTSATPEQIKDIFGRSCLLIGRRFRLAHVRFGRHVIEVSTFRSGENADELIVRDNVWGSAEEDVLRRDFTINGLFYDPSGHKVIDYVGGWEDIHAGVLSTIGDPDTRFRQDPVRMIRALKFRARFNFSFDDALEQSIRSCREEITKSAPARILEEIFRMLESTASEPFFRLLYEYNFLDILFPMLSNFIREGHGEELFDFLRTADQLIPKRREPYHRAILGSLLVYPLLRKRMQKEFIDQDRNPHLGDISLLTGSVIDEVISSSFSHFPRRISSSMNFILTCQYRFTPLSSKRRYKPKLLRDHDTPMALSFLRLRSVLNPDLAETYEKWRKLHYHQSHPPGRNARKPGKRYRSFRGASS